MALQLEEFVDSIENLPGELKHYFAEIRTRDDAAQGNTLSSDYCESLISRTSETINGTAKVLYYSQR